MINKSNIINLNSYIRISSIKESFEDDCLYVTREDQLKEVKEHTNIIFETSQLKTRFFEYLTSYAIDHTIINCLSSLDIFENKLFNSNGIVIFDNICCCKNHDILKILMKYKNKKLLVC